MSEDTSIWALGSYTFPRVLTLIDDVAIENILSDIPFVAVGLLSFGVLTFFLVMKQHRLSSLVLNASVIIAFFAAIFDLSQLITRGRNHSSNLPSVSGLVTARDVFLAIASGFRYLFFWLYVAEPPRGETTIPLAHSGTWGRWGLVGFLLKWILLAVALTISILQIIWRVAPGADHFGTVYGADSAIEIIASAVLLLKLLLNVSITSITPRYKALQDYSAVIVALSINLGVGIGNVVTFAFSESVLGRFLMAIEIYILVVYSLISSFCDYVPAKPIGHIDSKIPIENLPETKGKSDIESNRYINAPDPGVYQSNASNDLRVISVARTPSVTRFASWIMPRRRSDWPSIGDGDQAHLWSRAETGVTPAQPDRIVPSGRDSPYSYHSFVGQVRESQQLVVSDTGSPLSNELEFHKVVITTSSLPADLGSNGVEAAKARDSIEVLQPPRIPRIDTESSGSYSLGSYYDGVNGRDQSLAGALGVTRRIDSPIYGLDGILRPAQEGRQVFGSATRPRDSGTSVSSVSFGELLRQQSELDNSIAVLRLLSPEQGKLTIPTSFSDPGSPNGESNGMPSSLHGSEFSLNDFPEPPSMITATANGLPPLTPTSPPASSAAMQEDRVIEEVADGAGTYLPIPKMPVLGDFPSTPRSIPHSPVLSSEDSVVSSRIGVNSGGTQYDVTSFIGNLMNPNSFKDSLIRDKLTDIQSEDGATEAADSGRGSPIILSIPEPQLSKAASRNKPALLDTSLLSDRVVGSYSPATASSGIWTGRPSIADEPQRVWKPSMSRMSHMPPMGSSLSQMVAANTAVPTDASPTSQISSHSYVDGPLGPRRRPPPAGSLPLRPRLTESAPKPTSPGDVGEQSLKAYKGSRISPLVSSQEAVAEAF